jgi:hypothetical protein
LHIERLTLIGFSPIAKEASMRKVIICLLALFFLFDITAYAAGPAGGYGGSPGGRSGSGTSYGGSGYGGRPGGYSGSGHSYQGSPGGSYGGSNNYHGTGGYHGYRGYPGGYPYHGNGNYHHGNGNSYSVWIGGGWYPGYWGPAYPRYYSYYPYYYPYAYAPGAVAEQPQLSAPAQDQDSYWYYCENPQGYYPYVKSCPGGWMKVVPETEPPGGR